MSPQLQNLYTLEKQPTSLEFEFFQRTNTLDIDHILPRQLLLTNRSSNQEIQYLSPKLIFLKIQQKYQPSLTKQVRAKTRLKSSKIHFAQEAHRQ